MRFPPPKCRDDSVHPAPATDHQRSDAGEEGGTPEPDRRPRRAELDLETTGCLCVCDRPCAIAFVGTHKPSFLFGDLSPETSAEDLLIAAELYLDKADGMVPAYDLPLPLRSRRIARMPAAP